jgi:signal transduction histidine kinase
MGNGMKMRRNPPAWLTRVRSVRAGYVTPLAISAVCQAILQAVGLGADRSTDAGATAAVAAEYVLPLGLFALLATVPLAVYRPAMASAAVTFGNVLALAAFGQVTAGGAVAEVIAAWWLGLEGARAGLPRAGLTGAGLTGALGARRAGGTSGPPAGFGAGRGIGSRPGDAVGLQDMPGRYLAFALALPFLVIALAGHGWAAVVLAAAVPVAAGLGIAAWAARLARTRTAAGEALADTLLAHTARGERARIARELHDVVAHHISMIAVLAETGRLTTPGLPADGARRFGEIGDTARAGLTEMRRLLGVLREDAAAAEDTVFPENAVFPGNAVLSGNTVLSGNAVPLGDTVLPGNTVPSGNTGAACNSGRGRSSELAGNTGLAGNIGSAGDAAAGGTPEIASAAGAGTAARRASRQPQPGIAQLTGLIDAARDASGTGTRLIISGPVAPLGPGVELAAYRITQEALTNARRHAQGAAVDVELRYSPGSLRLRIRDNGPGPGGARAEGEPGSGGHGLAGMRERAFSAGGSLYTGVAPGGGFLVEAVLPAERGDVGTGARR